MNKDFDYLFIEKPEKSISIDDIGNVNLIAYNDLNYFWCLQIRTELGESFIKQFGPFNKNPKYKFENGFKYEFSKIDYKESKIINIIEKFITEPKKLISEVLEVDSNCIDNFLYSIDFINMR